MTYSAFDSQRNETVAIKIEKPNKPKQILALEYQFLKTLQDLPHICPVYEFVDSLQMPYCKEYTALNFQGLNFIVMKMLGKNLSALKRQRPSNVVVLELLVTVVIT